jgi:hypothetical protein
LNSEAKLGAVAKLRKPSRCQFWNYRNVILELHIGYQMPKRFKVKELWLCLPDTAFKCIFPTFFIVNFTLRTSFPYAQKNNPAVSFDFLLRFGSTAHRKNAR